MAEEKRERILDAALNKFEQYGFLKTTVEEIAKRAQVAKGTIYSYFPSKEELLLALVDRELRKGYIQVGNAIYKEEDPMEQIRQLFRGAFEYFKNNKLISSVMAMDQGLALSLITDKNRELQGMTITTLASILEQGRNEGKLREVEDEKVAYIMDSLLRSFHYLYYLGLSLHETSDILDSLMDLLSYGLAAE